jgi:mannonate dehydratase
MHRRDFLTATGAAALVPAVSAARPPSERKPVKMHVGCQRKPTSAEMLRYFKRHGVEHIVGYPEFPRERGYWTAEDVRKLRDLGDKHGVSVDVVAFPFLTSSHIDREERGAIMLGKDPDRGRDMDHLHKMIAACAQAGVPAIKYNMSLLGVLRTGSNPGRGGSRYRAWKLADARKEPELTRAGKVSADLAWERITWFLERVVPVCNEHKVRIACHPHDPGVPADGFQGVCRVLGTPEGLKKFVSIKESPYHGLNLCIGTLAEMLDRPGEQVYDVVRWFGERQKVFLVHLRNIRGRRDDFEEVYPDEGDVDLTRVLRELHQSGYDGLVCPDHMPSHDDDPKQVQAFAFGYGYIKGILQTLASG